MISRLQKSYVATAPSNIAFIKYWGKRDPGMQWPANDSLSMTLSHAHTTTAATLSAIGQDSIVLNGITLDATSPTKQRIVRFLDFLRQEFHRDDYLSVETCNSFPTACGIASSASGFAALTLAAIAAFFDCETFEDYKELDLDLDRLANLARMGSGSAGRSLFGGVTRWNAGLSPQDQHFFQIAAASHWALCDLIVFFSDEPKTVPTREGHGTAWSSPLFRPRLAELPTRLRKAETAIIEKDLMALGSILEQDAIEMHGVMMSATPRLDYFTEHTQNFLEWLRTARHRENLPAYFTLDAGSSIHVICESCDRSIVKKKITETFPNAFVIDDEIGSGPSLSVRKDRSKGMDGNEFHELRT